MYSAEQIQKLRIVMANRISPIAYYKLLAHFGNNISNMMEELLAKYNDEKWIVSEDSVLNELSFLEKIGGELCFHDDEDYPVYLHGINNNPPILWILGNKSLLSESKIIAIVGSRNPSGIGTLLARKFATGLSKNSYVTCSGMAAGIDTIVHSNSLLFGTVAVLPTGLNVIYPKSNLGLYHEIKKYGVLVSEYPVNFKAKKWSFYQRNRIVAGISLATLIIEAKINSGSLLTANHTINQKRNLFVTTPAPLDCRFFGNLELLKQKKALVMDCPEELLEYLDKKYILQSEVKGSFEECKKASIIRKSELIDFEANHEVYYAQILDLAKPRRIIKINQIMEVILVPRLILEIIIVKMELLGQVIWIDEEYLEVLFCS